MIETIFAFLFGAMSSCGIFAFWYVTIFADKYLPIHMQLPQAVKICFVIIFCACVVLGWLPFVSCFLGE